MSEESEVVNVGNKKFILDRKILSFDETNINEFLSDFAGLYDNFGEASALANAEQDSIEHRYEVTREEKMVFFKENEGISDKLASSKAFVHESVQQLYEKLIKAKYRAKRLNVWMRSLDNAHESAKEVCYNIRKEINIIGSSTIKQIQKFQIE